jgi:hypothetical protein
MMKKIEGYRGRRTRVAFAIPIGLGLMALAGMSSCGTQDQPARTAEPTLPAAAGPSQGFQQKLQTLQEGIQQWQKEGRDLSPVGKMMQEFEPLMKEGKLKKAEAKLDEVLALLKEPRKGQLLDEPPQVNAPEEIPVIAKTERTPPSQTKYLTFQIFTGGPDPTIPLASSDTLSSPPSKHVLAKFVQNIIDTIGAKGNKNTTLGFTVGPLAFDNTDEEMRRLIRESFEIAQEKSVAIAFHIDDSMFWGKRRDLWSKRANIEWIDWSGTPNTGRKIDWGAAMKLPPQMCVNSKEIRAEVKRLAKDVIGKEIQKGVDKLSSFGKKELFAGVIAGWETQIGKDFKTGKTLGYCALTNQGLGANNIPEDLDLEREKTVRDFIALWAKGLSEAGIDKRKIYSHTAFVPKQLFDRMIKAQNPSETYSQLSGFAPPTVSFHEAHNPGFSTYPAPGLFEQIYDELKQHGKQDWASSEGANISLGASGGTPGMTMETYLAKHFNHGATLVNIFAWGVGGDSVKSDKFRVATEGENAIKAYRKFLKGEDLTEGVAQASDSSSLQTKMHKIQNDLPVWIQKTGNQSKVAPLLQKLDGYIKNQKPQEAEKVADEILNLIEK